MPSIRKRIGYLPSLNIQEIISNIAKNENLSQSKVVGILVEEALIARGTFDLKKTNDLSVKSSYRKVKNMNTPTFNYSDHDELISDKGIIYNSKKYNHISDNCLAEAREAFNKDLFEQFKQFILFKKMIEEEQ